MILFKKERRHCPHLFLFLKIVLFLLPFILTSLSNFWVMCSHCLPLDPFWSLLSPLKHGSCFQCVSKNDLTKAYQRPLCGHSFWFLVVLLPSWEYWHCSPLPPLFCPSLPMTTPALRAASLLYGDKHLSSHAVAVAPLRCRPGPHPFLTYPEWSCLLLHCTHIYWAPTLSQISTDLSPKGKTSPCSCGFDIHQWCHFHLDTDDTKPCSLSLSLSFAHLVCSAIPCHLRLSISKTEFFILSLSPVSPLVSATQVRKCSSSLFITIFESSFSFFS